MGGAGKQDQWQRDEKEGRMDRRISSGITRHVRQTSIIFGVSPRGDTHTGSVKLDRCKEN